MPDEPPSNSPLYPSFQSDGHSRRLLLNITADARRLKILLLTAAEAKGPLWPSVSPILFCVFQDSENFVSSVEQQRLRLAYMTGRALFEGTLNAMRIAVGGNAIGAMAELHAKQKFFRDLDRSSEVEGSTVKLRWSGLDHLTPPQPLLDAAAKYTRKSGSEETSWIKETVEDKIGVVGKHMGGGTLVLLQLAMMGCYRHSSEVLHGTLYGALLTMGYSGIPHLVPPDADPRPSQRTERVAILCQSVAISMSLTCQLFAKVFGASKYGEESEAQLVSYLEDGVADKL